MTKKRINVHVEETTFNLFNKYKVKGTSKGEFIDKAVVFYTNFLKYEKRNLKKAKQRIKELYFNTEIDW